eukprot:4673556-Amphidinium_carterae.1
MATQLASCVEESLVAKDLTNVAKQAEQMRMSKRMRMPERTWEFSTATRPTARGMPTDRSLTTSLYQRSWFS